MRNLEIGTQFPDSENAQHILEISQIPILCGTYTYCDVHTLCPGEGDGIAPCTLSNAILSKHLDGIGHFKHGEEVACHEIDLVHSWADVHLKNIHSGGVDPPAHTPHHIKTHTSGPEICLRGVHNVIHNIKK